MPNESGDRTVLIATADLVFRSKLEAVARAAGFEPVREGTAPVAVVELARPGAIERIETLVQGGARVLAFGPHVLGDLLEAATRAGASAVPNSGVERALRDALAGA
jgi:hypothetical protein